MYVNQKESQSTAELVQQASDQVSRLIKDEMRLARAEVVGKGRQARTGAALFGATGVTALLGAGALVACVIIALSIPWPAWLAALVVGAALMILAGIMGAVGRSRVKGAMPPKPTQAVNGVRNDIDAVRSGVTEGRAHR
ncbi:membrane protein [Acrocarpospora phusangensis]|uniref:Membrane protein n=1 Tax=Acrocarpospora phusangensis TaxID=1070424 RepID=A0A919UP72_9ACTN|nr:phage holin family protein [Acrocarpospora phusangensis]GIH25068.1 membrane protein [Acrocarpospora phusangensis]